MVGRDIHNVSTVGEHVRNGGSASEVHASQVDVDDIIKILDGAFIRIFRRLCGANNASVADDDVNPAHCPSSVINKTFDLYGLADIGNLGINNVRPLTELFGDFNHARIFVADADKCPGLRKRLCYCISETIGGASNDCFSLHNWIDHICDISLSTWLSRQKHR